MLPLTRAMFIHGSNFYEQFGSNFYEQFLKKGHQRKIPVKLFQNLTSGFREEDFLKIFLKKVFFMSV